MLQRWVQETHAQFWDQKPKKRDAEEFGNAYGRIPYQIWSVNKYGSCADAAITGIMPPPLMELQVRVYIALSYVFSVAEIKFNTSLTCILECQN